MDELSVRFSEGTPVLDETVFRSAGKEERRAVRGRERKDPGRGRPFQWTLALRALMVLILKFKAYSLRTQGKGAVEPPVFSGDTTSLLKSLNWALSGKTGWLGDIFGTESNGKPVIYFIKRNNIDFNRGPRVKFAVDCERLPPKNIKVYQGQVEIEDADSLDKLAEKIVEEARKPFGNLETSITGRNGMQEESTPDSILERYLKSAGYSDKIADPRAAVLVSARKKPMNRIVPTLQRKPTARKIKVRNRKGRSGNPQAPTKASAGIFLLGFWQGQFGTYTTWMKDDLKVSGEPKQFSQSWFKSQADETWAQLERTMNRLNLCVSRAAIEEDRTNPLIVMEEEQKRLYRAVERRFSTEEARTFLYGDFLGGELYFVENFTWGVTKSELVASLWAVKRNQLARFGTILNLPQETELVEIVNRLSQASADLPTLLKKVQRVRERIAGRCEEFLFSKG